MEHYIIQGLEKKGNVIDTIFFVKINGSKADACRICTDLILVNLGDGDNENDGRGSLKNCYGDIWNALYNTTSYEYANCSFSVQKCLRVMDYI